MASIEELMNLTPQDVARMSRKELGKVVTQLSAASNKRLARLETLPTGKEAPAYQTAMKRGRFTAKGKNQGELQNEYKRARSFLASNTSTIKGWNSVRKQTYERLGGDFNDDEDREKRFWKAYRDLSKSERALMRSYGSENVQSLLYSQMNKSGSLTNDEIREYREMFPDDAQDLHDLSGDDVALVRTLIEMAQEYEEQAGREYDIYGDGFFTLDNDER